MNRLTVMGCLEGLTQDDWKQWYSDSEVQETAKAALALLKEQEAVKPVNIRWEMGINGGNCPKCMNWVQRTYNYCPFCGKVVKWE